MTQTTTLTVHPPIDVHDMVVVHRALRRELRIIPHLVRQVTAGDSSRAAIVSGHCRLALDGLHVHHSGEDALLWPMLLERAAPSSELVQRMQAQHHRIEDLVDRLRTALVRWEVEARPAVGAEVASIIDELGSALLEHLDEEETHILPLAAAHLTQVEWDAIGHHGLATMSRSQLPLLFWMILEDASPDERATMLASIPPPIRFVLKTVAARRYRRYVTSVRTTA